MYRFLFQRESIPVIDAAMNFANQRHKAIMNNIANVETPYYKRQGVPEAEFHNAMIEALEERSSQHPSEFSMDDTQNITFRHAGLVPDSTRMPAAEYGPERHDENSVVIEKEMADLAKNTLYIETLQRLLRKKYGMMQAALRDRVI